MRKFINRFLKSSGLTAVFSLLLAIVGWYVVVYSISPLTDKELTNVTASVTLPTGYSLNIIGQQDVTFDVKVEGMRYNIGNLSAADVQLYADTSSVIRPGEYDLTILPVLNDDTKYTVVSVYPQTINVVVDRNVSVAIPIEYAAHNLSVPENGYLLGEHSIYPESVTVTGPESEVSLISRAVVNQTFADPQTTSVETTAFISLYNVDDEPVYTTDHYPESHISTDYDSVKISIPVLTIADLPITFSFINVPPNFPLNHLYYTMSNRSIAVAATEQTLDRYFELSLGHIDISQLDLLEDNSIIFDVTMPTNMVNYSSVENVVVNFDVENLAEKRLNIANMTLLNVPPLYSVRVMTSVINNVKFIGESEALANLTADDIVAEIDFALLDMELGQYQVPVTLHALTDDMVWAVGKYQVIVHVQMAS